MKVTDRSILFGLLILGLLACFWFMLLAPKREDASALQTEVDALQDEVAQQEQLAVAAEDAQQDYAKNYEQLVALGKAAPANGDTPSLLTLLSAQSKRSGTEFAGLTVGGAEVAPAPPPTSETTTDQNAEEGTPTSATPVEPAIPTEAIASTLPLGATVGPAGLGILPYSLQFTGDFFEVADLLERIDKQVGVAAKGTAVDGRLMTINGFTMAPGEKAGDLAVDLSITTYVLPTSQGLTAGATPTAPPAAVPAATTVPTAATP